MATRFVPGLGDVTGFTRKRFPYVEQYRGIQYGVVPARFRQSQPLAKWQDGKWDATKYGPLAPFPRMVIGMGLTQKSLAPEHNYEMDEFQCLNLNVTCPAGSTTVGNYPVAVWIHGGGNVVGSGAEPGYDMAAFVQHSVEIGLPTVAVTINYRLGALGFLASDDIKMDNEAAGDQGVGNYGVRDQLLAFEWVKNNIAAFGGDPTRVTAIGQSAGSIDIHLNVCSELFGRKRPFHQAILQSGVAPLTVRGMAHQNETYKKLLSQLKIGRASLPEEKIRQLRAVPVEDLLDSYQALGSPVPSWQVTVDGYYLKYLPRYASLSEQIYDDSLRRLLLGDCAEDGLIFSFKVQSMGWTGERICALATKVLGGDDAQKLLNMYGIKEDTPSEELFSRLIRLLTDAEWSQPMNTVARSFSNGDVFYYHMTEVNPFPGPNAGRAHHGVDLLFNFLTYQDHLSHMQKNLSITMARHWIRFVHGENPWTPYNADSSMIMHYGDGGKATEISQYSQSTRQALRLIETLQDRVSDLAAAIKGDHIILDD